MKKIIVSSSLLLFCSCSSSSDVINIFPQKLDPADQATKYLEEEKPDKAIALMLAELGSDFASIYNGLDQTTVLTAQDTLSTFITDNTKATYASILASAEAHKLGLDPIDLILKSAELANATNNQSSSQSSNVVIAMWPILPIATAENVLAAKKASAALMSISNFYIPEDKVKLTVFQLATTSLSLKAMDLNGNNQLDLNEITSLDTTLAAAFLSQIVTAALAAASIDPTSGANAEGIGSQITQVTEAIQASAGSNDQEKLQNWLSGLSRQ